MIERNEDGSIQKTISEAIEELSFDGGHSTESNVTEDIAQELTADKTNVPKPAAVTKKRSSNKMSPLKSSIKVQAC